MACEFSGIVRDAFNEKGHDAWSCDLLPTESNGRHIQGDVLNVISDESELSECCISPMRVEENRMSAKGPCVGTYYVCQSCNFVSDRNHWDLLIAFPPCTHLAVSGARWFKDKQEEQKHAIKFFLQLAQCGISKIAIENPIGIMSSHYRKPDQIIQPWMFGHGETKATCLWLKNLPPLQPTNVVEGRPGRVWREPPGTERWKNRSRTYPGIAKAMAEQWGRIEKPYTEERESALFGPSFI